MPKAHDNEQPQPQFMGSFDPRHLLEAVAQHQMQQAVDKETNAIQHEAAAAVQTVMKAEYFDVHDRANSTDYILTATATANTTTPTPGVEQAAKGYALHQLAIRLAKRVLANETDTDVWVEVSAQRSQHKAQRTRWLGMLNKALGTKERLSAALAEHDNSPGVDPRIPQN